MGQGKDSHYYQLATVAANLESDFPSSIETWGNSPFKWIKSRPSRTVGAIFEALVEGWLVANDMEVSRSGDSDADRVVEGIRVEIKGSTLWKAGTYKFQQIRDQNYELIICLGISPLEAHCWVIPKSSVPELWKAGVITGQHTGRQATDTGWISVNPNEPPTIACSTKR